ncbi:beta-galactosidase [Pseudoduganella namucuonensis]|uniref:beta-galactosidase n=1 Tax=Pseudoduganella namucuonensis TaxID=1035707 RepID=A0A1I7GQH6_9BURK|nr:beta-galactosidase [Pseudoduganella namucuonensis]SFU50704.1 Beta-galactosidase, domain 3 [Pseudoduganella namucuonensis]
MMQQGPRHRAAMLAMGTTMALAVNAALPAWAHAQAQPQSNPEHATPPAAPTTGDALMDTFGLTSANKVQTQGQASTGQTAHLKVVPRRGDTSYIMAAFPAAAENTLSIFTGYDGQTYTSLASEAYKPAKGGLRDPSIIHANDGYYYVAYTTGSKGGSFGLARSRDLRRWSHVRDIALALPSGAAASVRAPEWLRDRDGKVHLVVSAAGNGGKFSTYLLSATDASLTRYAKPRLMKGLENDYVDAFVLVDGDGYRVFARNQASGRIEMASAKDLSGPWSVEPAGDWGAGVEAPALVKLPDGGWRIYFEDGKRYYHSDSRDNFKTWTPKAELATVSGAARHFTVLAEPTAVLEKATAPAGKPKKITWDKHSLLIDGERKMIWGGEMHPFRLPSPSLWRDVLEKMKASGLNTVAFYFDWGYHSARPGEFDFTGIRNMEKAIEMAEELGMYIIIRVGPYVNAELTMGGFPGWLARQHAVARTDAPDYIAASDEWLTQINAIVARHQVTNGGGNVILYQLENELSQTTDTHKRYMQYLHDKARADGISVPLFHNSAGRLPNWTPVGSSAPYAVPGPTDLYAFDGYPGGGCTNTHVPGKPNVVPNWGMYGEMPKKIDGPVKIGALASPNTPGFAAEIGGGWFDFWGSVGSYECTAKRIGSGYQRVFYGSSLINGLSIHSVYMMFGGTSWGWTPASVVYTSYDYGAAIDEGRGLREKALTLKQMGNFVQAAEGLLAEMEKAEPLATSSERVKLYHNISPKTGARLIYVAHNPSDATTNDPFSFKLTTRDGSYAIPQAGKLGLNGHDAKLLLADYALERQHLVYTTSDTQTHFRQGARDVALLYGRAGEDGETVLRYAGEPKVEVLQGAVSQVYDGKRGDLRLNYVHQGLAVVRITPAGGAPLLLLLGDDDTGRQMWKIDTAQGPVLLRSAALVRSASWERGALAVTGDASAPSTLDVWTEQPLTALRFNGQALKPARGADGRVSAGGILGPRPYKLPDLMALQWGRRLDSPEAKPEFDDSGWRKADLAASAATIATLPPQGQPVLAMSDYGFHHGDVWYRGRFEVRAGQPLAERLEVAYGGGGAGMAQVWLDGKFIGQHELPGGDAKPVTVATTSFDLPALAAGPHLLSVMVRNNSHNWDLAANDEHKEGRGLISASLGAKQGPKFATPVSWKIQGSQGGEVIPDLVRGPMNNGGLWGERQGWHLPSPGAAVDRQWQSAAPGAAPPQAGTYWLRTKVKLDLPKDHDIQLGLVFGDAGKPRSDPKTRVLMFVNGWNMGNFISNMGPQRTFVLPPGVLNANGDNTIALAVTTDGKPENALEPVKLVTLRAARGGVKVEPVGQSAALQR